MKQGLQRKEHSPFSQTWRRFTDVLGLLCCFWHQMPWLCEWHHEIWWLLKNFGAQCQKAASLPEVRGHGSSSRTKSTQTWLKKKCWRVLKWPTISPDVNPREHLCRHFETAAGRRHRSNLKDLEQFAKEKWFKILEDRCKKLVHGYRKWLISVISSTGCATKY